MEALEPRLALTWAGVPPTFIAAPTTALAVTLNTQNDAAGAASITTTEIDYYSFTARTTGTHTFAAATPSSNLDTVIGVFAANGQRLAYNDDVASTNTDSRVSASLVAGARYYFGVTNYAINSRGAYSWTIDGPAPVATTPDDAYENNDSLGTAYNLGTLSSASRSLSALRLVDGEDWYRFTTTVSGTSASSAAISFQNAQGNLQLALYNSAGTLLATSAGTGNGEAISLSGRAAGTYYMRVYASAGATNPNYSLTVTPPTVISTPPPTAGGFQITLSMSGLTTNQQAIFNQAADRWEQVIVGDLPNATYRGQMVDDVLINASSVAIDGLHGILGEAGPDALRSGSRLPYHGVMRFDTADIANMERNGSLMSVVMHEMGHVLGIGTIWSSLGLLSGAGTSNPTFRGAQATAAYNQLFGANASGVPVENTGGPGTRDAHWRDGIFRSELMTGWVGPGANLPLSRVTAASLADMGYTVNFAMADAFVPTATMISSAQQASAGAGSARLLGISTSAVDPATSVVSDWFTVTSSHFDRVPQRWLESSPSSVIMTASELNERNVDAVMMQPRPAAGERSVDSMVQSDDADEDTVASAWEEFQAARPCWPLLSLA
jgi:hypothetical protein